MARIIRVKNGAAVSKTYVGVTITAGTYYDIVTEADAKKWADSSKVFRHIGDPVEPLIVNKGTDTTDDISDSVEAFNWLSGNIATTVEVKEENISTGGYFQVQGYKMSIAANENKQLDISWPYPVSLLSSIFTTEAQNAGDNLEVQIAPDTITGTTTQDVAIAATVINVSQTVIDNVSVGFYIKLSDGTNTDNLGRVLSIDSTLLTITVETATVNTFLSATPTYVKQTVKMAPYIPLQPNGTNQIGTSKIGGSYLPANKVIRVIYSENSGAAKTFFFIMEYLY